MAVLPSLQACCPCQSQSTKSPKSIPPLLFKMEALDIAKQKNPCTPHLWEVKKGVENQDLARNIRVQSSMDQDLNRHWSLRPQNLRTRHRVTGETNLQRERSNVLRRHTAGGTTSLHCQDQDSLLQDMSGTRPLLFPSDSKSRHQQHRQVLDRDLRLSMSL